MSLATNTRSAASLRDTTVADDMACFDQLPAPLRKAIGDSCCGVAARSVLEQWLAYRNQPGFSLERFVIQFCIFDEQSERDTTRVWSFPHTEPFQHPLLRVLRSLKSGDNPRRSP